MARNTTGTDYFPALPKSVRIVVVGDKGTGKSSLINAGVLDGFNPNVPPVLPDTNLPFEFLCNGAPITIVDTSSRPEDRDRVAEELKHADAVILTFTCDRPETLDRLNEYWIPELNQLGVKVPIIVAACKYDLIHKDNEIILEQGISTIMQQLHVEGCIDCSALKQVQAKEVFYYAQRAVLHRTAPLFDQETKELKPWCARALKRIFKLCDHDNDDALSAAELNDFQVKCFNAPLEPSAVEGFMRVLKEVLPEGVNERGLTVDGFLFLQTHFIEKGRFEETWTVLRKFGYNKDIRLADELLPASLPKSVRIVVVGDKGTGKSSLINAGVLDCFDPNVPPVLPDTKFPSEFLSITIVDTSSRPEDRDRVAEELEHADAVILTFTCDRPETLDRLNKYWIPELNQLEVKVPIIVAGCKYDLIHKDNKIVLKQGISTIAQRLQVQGGIECSALKQVQAKEVFYYAQRTVLHRTIPLFDRETKKLKPRCARALKRIFKLCDRDNNDALSVTEFSDFQVKCFNAPMEPSEIETFMRALSEVLPEGVNERGMTVTGFLFLQACFLDKGRFETAWTVLRKFGYNNDIRLADELLPASLFKREPDQSIELRNVATKFLEGVHTLFDKDKDNILSPQEIEDLFSTAPDESPWKEAPYEHAADRTVYEGLSLDAFLSLWSLMTLLEPARSVEHLIYIGFTGDPSTAIRITRRRSLDRKHKNSDRNVYQCFVFGPNNAGKSALFLDPVLVNMVKQYRGAKKALVMREIKEDEAEALLSSKETMAACDVAVFMYDNSDESSLRRAADLLIQAIKYSYSVPCLMVSATDTSDDYSLPSQESIRMAQYFGIEPPVSISTRLLNFKKFFRKILSVAKRPHLNIPKNDEGKSCFDRF